MNCLGNWRIPELRNLERGVLSLLNALDEDFLLGQLDWTASDLTLVAELEGELVGVLSSSLPVSSTKSCGQFQCNACGPRWTNLGLRTSALLLSVGQRFQAGVPN